MPRDFATMFERAGWEAIQDECRAGRATVKRWMMEFGEAELRRRRRIWLERQYAENHPGKRIRGRAPRLELPTFSKEVGTVIDRDPEVILAHGAMQDAALLHGTDWRDSIPATSIELAKLVVRFKPQLTDDECFLLTHLGGGLLRADRELSQKVVIVDRPEPESRP